MDPTVPAEIAAALSRLMGDDGPAWMLNPAMGLNRQRPVDLLLTEEGVQQLHDFLGRLEYGVYS